MTLKQLRDAVKAIIGNDTELQNADFDTFINEGKGNVEAKILDERKDFFPDTENISVVSGTTIYSPAKTWINITLIQIDFADGAGYQTLKSASLEEVLNPGNSMIFCNWGSQIYIPDFAKAATLRIYGYILPAELSGDSDTPVFSTLLHPLLITWAVGRAVEANSSSENFLDGGRKRAEFWETLEQLLPTVILKDSTNVRSLI